MIKKILLFGSHGFIGNNLTNTFRKNRAFELIAPTTKQCNLLTYQEVSQMVEETQPHFIINSAFIGVNSSIPYSDEYLSNNTKIVANICRASTHSQNLVRLIHFGSSLEYGSSPKPLNERNPLNPLNTYATVKTITSYVALDLGRSLQLPLLLVKPFNLYGPHDSKSVIYYIIKSILHSQPLQLTHGKQIRDYMYIEDMCKILNQIITKSDRMPKSGIFNLSTGRPQKLKSIFDLIFTELDYKGKIQYREYPQYDYWCQIGNSRKLYSIIDRPHFTSLKSGLAKTIQWIKSTT